MSRHLPSRLFRLLTSSPWKPFSVPWSRVIPFIKTCAASLLASVGKNSSAAPRGQGHLNLVTRKTFGVNNTQCRATVMDSLVLFVPCFLSEAECLTHIFQELCRWVAGDNWFLEKHCSSGCGNHEESITGSNSRPDNQAWASYGECYNVFGSPRASG